MTSQLISKHFTIERVQHSATAKAKNVPNEFDTPQAVGNVAWFCTTVLDVIVDELCDGNLSLLKEDSSIYRNDAVNKLVKGSEKSEHRAEGKGAAADLEHDVLANLEFAKQIVALLDKRGIAFDQIILEKHDPKDPHSGWVHVGCRREGNRRQILKATFVGGKPTYTAWKP